MFNLILFIMKKLVFAIMALASIALVGCDRRSEEQKKCEDLVQISLKNPESYKFISFYNTGDVTYKDKIDVDIENIETVDIPLEKMTIDVLEESKSNIEKYEKKIDSLKSLYETEKDKLDEVLYSYYYLNYYATNSYNAQIKNTAKFKINPQGEIIAYCIDDNEWVEMENGLIKEPEELKLDF